MKKLVLVLVVIAFAVTSCNVKSSEIKNFNTDNISYVKDDRCDICFAIVASRTSGNTDQGGFGITEVDCEKVKHLLK